MAIENPHFYSTTSGTTTTTQITDEIDYPHSGLIKALSQGIRGNYAIKGSATDFDITLTSSTFTQIAVTAGKAYRDGKLVSISQLSATNLTGIHATEDVYQLLVAQANNTMALRGSNSVTNRIPDLTDGDIPIAVIKLVAGSAQGSNGTSDRLIQFLTTSKVSNDLSVGYDSSGYTESLSMSASSGDTTIENKVQDKDIIFKVNDGGASSESMRIDGDINQVKVKSLGIGSAAELTITESSDDVTIKNTVADKDIIFQVIDADGDGGSPLVADLLTLDAANQLVHIKTNHATNALLIESTQTDANSAPDIMFYKNRTPAATNEDIGHVKWRSKTDSGATSDYADIFVETQVITNGSESGKMQIRTKKGGTLRNRISLNATKTVLNEDSQDIDFVVEGDSDANLIYANAGSDKVGIGLDAPKTKLTVEGAITLKEQANADADTAAYGQLWTKNATPNELYFTNDAGNDIQITSGSSLAGSGSSALTFATFREDNSSPNSRNMSSGTDHIVEGSETWQTRTGSTALHNILEDTAGNAQDGCWTFTSATAGTYQINVQVQFEDVSLGESSGVNYKMQLLPMYLASGDSFPSDGKLIGYTRQINTHYWSGNSLQTTFTKTFNDGDKFWVEVKIAASSGSGNFRLKGASNSGFSNLWCEMIKIA